MRFGFFISSPGSFLCVWRLLRWVYEFKVCPSHTHLPYPLPSEASALKKVVNCSQSFGCPSLATNRNTPQNTSAASSCTSQATTAPRAAFRRAQQKKHRKNMGCSSSLPSEVIPDPGPTEQCTFTVKSAGMFKGDDCFAYRGDQRIKSNCRGASTSTPSTRRQLDGVALRDASSMAWRCGLLLPANEHPTHCLICAQAATRRTRTTSG